VGGESEARWELAQEELEQARVVLVKCLQHFMWRGNQQGQLQDEIKAVVPDWEERLR